MTKQEIKDAAIFLVDDAGRAGGSQLVRKIYEDGFTGAIDFVAMNAGDVTPEEEVEVREACRLEAERLVIAAEDGAEAEINKASLES